jgi:hypothetical protein
MTANDSLERQYRPGLERDLRELDDAVDAVQDL